MELKLLTFEEWIKLYPEENITEKCNECFGTGEISCNFCEGDGHTIEKDESGIEKEVCCIFCSGDGIVTCDICEGEGRLNLGREKYETQKAIDEERIKRIKSDESPTNNS